MRNNSSLCVICGFFDSGKSYIIDHIKFDDNSQYLPNVNRLYTDDIDLYRTVENVLTTKNICMIKPYVKDQCQYFNLNIINAKKKLLFVFRHPGISWFINRHKLALMRKGVSYSKLLNQYIININLFFKNYIGLNKNIEYFQVCFEDLIENKDSTEQLVKYLNIDISPMNRMHTRYFIPDDLDKIKDSLNLVTQEDLSLIYENLDDYMKYFKYEKLSLSTIMYQFANMFGYDSIVECLANIKKSIGVDLDGTLARYNGWKGISYIGEPIKSVVNAALKKEKEGYEIAVFTARASDPRSIPIIKNWLRNNNLPDWRITDRKDSSMKEIWDDLAVRVERNIGFK